MARAKKITATVREHLNRFEKWPDRAKNRIGSGIVGAILGNDPNCDRDEAMRRMVRKFHGAPSEFVGNIATAYGQRNEEGAIFDLQLERSDWDLDGSKYFLYDDWAIAVPDRLVGPDSLLEVKCPFKFRDDPSPEFKPLVDQLHYYDQVQFQLLCTDKILGYFYQWSPFGCQMETVPVDQEWREKNIPILQAFYKEYLKERAKEDSDHLRPKRPEIEGGKARLLVEEYDDLTDAMERAKARRDEVMQEIVELAKGENALIVGRKLTKVEKAGSISYAKAVAELLPNADLEKWRGNPSQYWLLGN